MKLLLPALLLFSPLLQAQMAMPGEGEMPGAREMPGEREEGNEKPIPVSQAQTLERRPDWDELDPALQQAVGRVRRMHGATSNWLLMADRFEYVDSDDGEALQWEAQGWIGGDYDRLWLKTEGEYDTEAYELEEAELQLLYSHALTPFWDLQGGLRRDEGEQADRSYLTLGLIGLAPYWFEIDAAAFVSEQGDLSARFEAEYELRLSQRLILQPRLELNYAFSDDAAAGIWQGLNDSSAGLRLRYEIRREFAPYLGLQWWRADGEAGRRLRRQGQDSSEFRLVAGLRFWY